MFRKFVVNISCSFTLFFLCLILTKAEYYLVELNPGFNYGEWYKTETGFNPDSQWFGAWVIAPKNDELYLGFATSAPAASDGVLLAKWVDEWLLPIGQFSEQGIHCIKWIGDTLYGIGSDPSITDGWDGGNFYKYYLGTGVLEKLRYNEQKKPILPRVLHSWGLTFDSVSKTFFLATSSYDPTQYSKNGNDCGDPDDSSLACFGQVWKSQDFGNSWELLYGRNPYEISPFRTMDVIICNGFLYATNDNNGYYPGNLKTSTDSGVTWDIFPDVVPSALYRMSAFQNKLIVADYDASSLYIIDDNGIVRTLFLPSRFNYSFNIFANVDNKFLITYFLDGSLYYTSNLLSWTKILSATKKNFLSIAYWEKEKSIVLAERGDTGSIWKLNISDLLSTDVQIEKEPEITFSSDNNLISLHSKNDEILSVEVTDVLGNYISVPVSTNSTNIKLDISQLTSGLYFIFYRTQKNYFVKKIMKL